MRIALCGYLGSGCTEVAEILASEFSLQTYNTSKILEMVKNFDSLSRSGEIDMDEVIKNKLDDILKSDNVIVRGGQLSSPWARRASLKSSSTPPSRTG